MSTADEELESPFASFADLLTGLVVIFILLASILALNQKANDEERETQCAEIALQLALMLTEGETLTAETDFQEICRGVQAEDEDPQVEVPVQSPGLLAVLATVKAGLEARGVTGVSITRGVVDLPERFVFASGSARISSSYALDRLRETLEEVLPCLSSGMQQRECPPGLPRLQAVVIEGHTDTEGEDADNMNLSVRRATNVYNALIESPQLEIARPYGYPEGAGRLMGIGAFGEHNPAVVTEDEVPEPRNRRVDIRFILQEQSP